MEKPTAKVRVRVKVEAVKIHGPNSPDVLDGSVPLDHRESIETEPLKTVELTEAEVREQFGDEIANEWFPKEDR